MDGKLLGAADGKPTDLLKDLVKGLVEKALASEKVRAMIAEIIKGRLPANSQTAKDIAKVEKAEAKAEAKAEKEAAEAEAANQPE